MTDHDRMGSRRDLDDEGGITLPSWVDAAIAKTRSGDEEPRPYAEEAEEAGALGAAADADSWSDEPSPRADIEGASEGEEFYDASAGDDFERSPASTGSDAPFPSFLERRPSFRQAAEPIEAAETAENLGPIPEPGSPLAFAQEPAGDEFEGYDELDPQRAQIVSEALAEASDSPSPAPEPIPLPVAPTRRRGASGPWLMAALFFAAAALVLAVLMWVRPLPR